MIIYTGLLKPLVKPIIINYAENRTAIAIPTFSISTFWDKSFQDQYEKAFADQLPLSSKMKKVEKNTGTSRKVNLFSNR